MEVEDFQENYSELDWYDAIRDAKRGLLSPYWQKIYREELRREAQETEWGELMLALLENAIRSCTQISDEEDARMDLKEKGKELLFFFLKDYKTRLEIIFDPEGGEYMVSLAIDSWQSAAMLKPDVKEMEESLDSWRREQGIPLNKQKIQGKSFHWKA